MDIKKDPGKFTIRFCMADPRQKKAVDELNAQGRLKAQFLTNAILHYVGSENGNGVSSLSELESIVRAMVEENAQKGRSAAQLPTGYEREHSTEADPFLTEENLSAIAGTLKAFRG